MARIALYKLASVFDKFLIPNDITNYFCPRVARGVIPLLNKCEWISWDCSSRKNFGPVFFHNPQHLAVWPKGSSPISDGFSHAPGCASFHCFLNLVRAILPLALSFLFFLAS